MRKEGGSNPAQYGKWIRAPARQKFSKENVNQGGYTKQSSATERTGEWSGRNAGSGRYREAELVEAERDNLVITATAVGEEGRVKTRLGTLCQSDSAHGKEKEPVFDAGTLLIDGEENQLTLSEMIWQISGGEEQQPKAGKPDSGGEKLGCLEAHLTIKEVRMPAQTELDQARKESTNANKTDTDSNRKREIQNKWKRLARDDSKENGITEQKEQLKNGTRGGNEKERSEEGGEIQGKKRKLGGDIEANIMAVAVEQPRRNQ